jgi:bifunctional non-homologous end joining protein LigD
MAMSVSRELKRRVGRYEPCLPRLAKEPPAGPGWIHEINDVKPITRKGFDLAQRFPLATAAIAALTARSCVVDSEAIACDANGLSVFDLLRYRRQDDAVTLCAFDLLELDGVDLRREPIEIRNRTLKGLLRREHRGIAFNRHFDMEGAVVYRHACALGCEGIVSKRLGSPYRPGRQDCWIKVKNPTAPAVRREAEEDWAR